MSTASTVQTITPQHKLEILTLPTQSEKRDSRWLVASPYLGTSHLLDLDTLDIQTRLFAIALATLKLATEDYANVKYEDVFDFDSVIHKLQDLARENGVEWKCQNFYVVEFRSTLKKSFDNDRLSFLDKESHREAVASGGLLKYWFGTPDKDRQNLATCFWRNKEDAILGGRGPQHREARGYIVKAYESINIKGLRFTVENDVSGWSIAPCEQGKAGDS